MPEKAKVPAIKNKPDITTLDVLGNGTVLIKWDMSVGADKYLVKRSKEKDSGYEKIATVKKKFTQYLDENIGGEGIFWYKISAWKKGPEGEKAIQKHSDPVQADVSIIRPPIAKEITQSGEKDISFKWTKGKDEVDGYVILRRYNFMDKPIEIARVNKDTFEYTDKATVTGQLYHYSVQGYLSDETGSQKRYGLPSEELSMICFDSPKVLATKRGFGKKVSFELRLTTGADRYVLLRSDEENGEYTEVARTDELYSLKLTDTGAKKKKTAYYKAACLKITDNSEFMGPATEAIQVKYKF
ncbi:MAG: hypothetical protein NC122_06830 [Faecalibacterium sp.]|nr:hypothetical protein [Ruminococcus sp.]MCM1392390.1 hypothetical protein [Ruminococcus sp.]MCM1485904.1 hypothetical protein [Faecalibacterium sp.]